MAAAAVDRPPWPERRKRRARFGGVARLPLIDIAARDIDVPLSPLGEQQSIALGQWFGRLPRAAQPNVVLCSPYVRARSTARLALEAAGIAADAHILHADERLRERIRNPRSADDVRHTRATSAAERAARTRWQVLLSSAGRGELVRCDSAAAQCDRHDDARVPR